MSQVLGFGLKLHIQVGTITTMNGKDLIKLLEADGWTLRGSKGSHHVFIHPHKPGHITVPHPKKDLGTGLSYWLIVQTTQASRIGEAAMKFIIALEPGTESSAWGVAVPDLPGCFSAGDTMEEAMENARQAIDQHIEIMIEDGVAIRSARSLSEIQADPEFLGWIWAVVDVPVEKYLGPAEKINITVPRLVLARIDEYAKSHGMSRSGFLVEAAQAAMHQ